MRLIESIKEKILINLADRGWYRNPKERRMFLGSQVWVTRGSFFRKNEKDDAWLYTLAQHHENIIDVGCNIGQSSMLMMIGTKNRMICIDPNARALSLCAENLIFNDLSPRAIFVNAFVGEEEGKEIDFFTIGSGAAGSMFRGFAKTANRHKLSIRVKTKTLSTICDEENFKPDLIKVDVEGAEQLVLGGLGEPVLSLKPKIFVEVHSGKELSISDNTVGILTWCKDRNYQAFYLKTGQQLLDVKEVSTRGRYHLLLVSGGQVFPEYLKDIPENSSLDWVLNANI
jgi:FkbM family methyltransferase